MTHTRLARMDRVMRLVHLYSSLFLVPWMLVYAASAFLINHGPKLNEALGIKPPAWEMVRQSEFVPHDAFPSIPAAQAKAILKHVELEGAHRIQGKPDPKRMVILRISGSGHYRITWLRPQSKVIVEKQRPFSGYRLIHFLHFKHGYQQPYAAHVAWAVVVDAVAVSMVLWVVSGIYMWARRPRKRWIGGVTVIAGSLFFVILVVLLCR